MSQDSVQCLETFRKAYKKQTGQEYNKTDKCIYRKLTTFGNETQAITTAANRLHNYGSDTKPSKMGSSTTVFKIINEIGKKINTKANGVSG